MFKQLKTMKNLQNIEKELIEAGFNFEDGLLGGVGSGGGGYYDFVSDKISGFNLDKFDENEFDQWYDGFSKDSFNSVRWIKEYSEENEDNIDYDSIKLKQGIYRVGNYGLAEICNNGDVVLYSPPFLSKVEFDELFIIFTMNAEGKVEEVIGKEEVKNILKKNVDKSGDWGII